MKNKNNYLAPAQWQVAHILFAVPADATAETEQMIKEKAEKVAQHLQKNPNDFENQVKQSDDKISIINGGVLPMIIAGQTEFDKALIKLNSPGEISPPIKSRHGYEIFKLISYKAARIKPLAQVKPEIHEQLLVNLLNLNMLIY